MRLELLRLFRARLEHVLHRAVHAVGESGEDADLMLTFAKEKHKVVFEDSYTNLIDIVSELRHAAERSSHNKILVSFEVNAEY